ISALQAGADEYLFKPVTWELLSRTIDQLLPQIPRQPKPTLSTGDDSQLARIKFWGVRGSIPIPGKSTVRYGGNTSCVEVRLMARSLFWMPAAEFGCSVSPWTRNSGRAR